MTFPTALEASNYRRVLEDQQHDAAAAARVMRRISAPGRTVADALEAHFGKLTGTTPRTLDQYRARARKHITPHIGAVEVAEFGTEHLGAWHRTLGATLSPKSIRECQALLSSAMTTAVAAGWRTDNPVRGAKIPRAGEQNAKAPRFLRRDEFGRLVAAMAPHYRPLVVVLAGTGIRWGEATGLKVGDVDLVAGVIRIRRSLQADTDGSLEYGPTKPGRSVRDVSLGADAVAALRLLVLGRPAGDPVFTGPRGVGFLYHGQFWARHWQPALERAGLDGLRIHDLRHSHASWLIAEGVPLAHISRRLGHSSIKITVDTYGHLDPTAHAGMADAIDRAIGAATPLRAVTSPGIGRVVRRPSARRPGRRTA